MVRTRFAPSPTGFLHVGGLRTALYAYLFARKNQGTFILRIEDTDQNRHVEGALENLLATFKQVGLNFDEGPEQGGSFGPYIQSQRTELYRKYAQELLEKKAAYLCFCTSERLDEMRERQTRAKQAPMYDRTCLNLSVEEIEKKQQEGIPFVIRQKIPHGQFLKFKDLIRGKVSFETATIDDQVLMKSDHFPTYHLANVVDDHLMEITHVIRGEEWLPSSPKHLLLYEAFGWTPPEFAHIPLLLNKDKTKLSKRQGDVSVESYLNKGYIKEALLNFIVLLGWHPGKGIEQEIFSMEELIQAFSLEQVHKAGAIFDIEKLDWFNFQWKKKIFNEKIIQKILELGGRKKNLSEEMPSENNPEFFIDKTSYLLSPEHLKPLFEYKADLLLKMCQQYLPENWLVQKDFLSKALITVEEKILKNPQEIADHLRFYFEIKDYDLSTVINEKMQVTREIAQQTLKTSLEKLTHFDGFEDIKKIQIYLLNLAHDLNFKNGQVLWPLRVVLSGEQYSPGVFEIMWTLGKEETLKRIAKGIEKF